MTPTYSLDNKITRYLESVGVHSFTISNGEIVVHCDPEYREKICGVITRQKLDLLAARVKDAIERIPTP